MKLRFSVKTLCIVVAGVISLFLSAGCYNDVAVYVKNNGLDNIHVNGKKIAQGKTEVITSFELSEEGDIRTYPVTRDDIQLGELIVKSTSVDDQEDHSGTITMNETDYFHLSATVTDGGYYIDVEYVDLTLSQ